MEQAAASYVDVASLCQTVSLSLLSVETLDQGRIHGPGRTPWEFIALFRVAHSLNLMNCFWNVPFNIFRLPVTETMGSETEGKRQKCNTKSKDRVPRDTADRVVAALKAERGPGQLARRARTEHRQDVTGLRVSASDIRLRPQRHFVLSFQPLLCL